MEAEIILRWADALVQPAAKLESSIKISREKLIKTYEQFSQMIRDTCKLKKNNYIFFN